MTSLRSTSLRALLTAAFLALAAAPARADGSVGVIVTGESTMQPQLVAQLETWLRAHGHELVSAPLPPDAISALIDCFVIEDQSCASRVVEKRAKSKVLVFAQATVTAGATADRAVTLTAYWFTKGKDPIIEQRTCERCTDVTMRRTADELMETLVGGIVTRIKVTSSPPGARVRLGAGKKAIGTTPFRYNFPLGDQRLIFELPDRAPETREVTVSKGEPTEIDVKFAREPSGPARWPGYACLAGAVALGAAGGILLAIDEDADPKEPTYTNTAPGGVALVAGGAVALGVGVYFLVRGPSKQAAPVAAFVPGGGGVVGWAGRF